jgi:hypothetical protein
MRNVIRFGAIATAAFTVWACSSSSTPNPSTGNNNNNSQDSGSNNNSMDSGTNSSPDAAMCTQMQVDQLLAQQGISLDGGVDGGVDAACINSMCSTEMTACMTEDCTTCGQAVGQCALTNCITLPTLPEASVADGGCDAPGPECTALSKCCQEISLGVQILPTLASFASQCTTNAASCDETACMGTIAAVDQINPSLCAAP